MRKSVGRVELSKRQDWSLEVSAKIYPFLGPANEYLVDTIVLGPNILRDSTLQRMECAYFEAYVHVSALMWVTAFSQLRFLTNATMVSLNPMEVNDLYDYLWKMGDKMKGPEALDIFEDAYEPWPQVQQNNDALRKWCEDKAEARREQRGVLRGFYNRHDRVEYEPILRELMALFGEAIQTAFVRNMSERLESTGGEFANSKLSERDKAKKKELICHNNAAERTFAVFRSMLQRYPSMNLRHAASIAFAKINGTFESAGAADPELRDAVSKLCSVRDEKEGLVTIARRAAHASDVASGNENRKRKRDEDRKHQLERAKKKATAVDKAGQIELVGSHSDLKDRILACGGKVTTTKTFLKGQVSSRILLGRNYPLSAVPTKYRKDTGNRKIRLTKPPEFTGSEIKYLTELAELMITYESKNRVRDNGTDVDLIRKVPILSEEYTLARSKKLREELKAKVQKLAAPKDDPHLVQYLEQYKGRLLYVHDDKPKHAYRIVDIQLFSGSGGDCWEATCEPIEPSDSGGWQVPKIHLAPGSKGDVVLNDSLYGIVLATLEDPDNPKKMPYVDEYIAQFECRQASK